MSVHSFIVARPKSEDKRNAILLAATQVFAERGLGAATAAISSAAGVAEGTLFTYFRTKDELLNALYREIKRELADAMMSGFPRKKSVRQRLQHVWDHFVEWGVANPQQHRVLTQIEVWGGLTPESKAAGSAPFVEIQEMSSAAVAQHIIQDLPQQFIAATMQALAQTTMEFMRQNPKQAEMYRNAGFEMLWAGIALKR
jgi:AcrR family transcriptional regulator